GLPDVFCHAHWRNHVVQAPNQRNRTVVQGFNNAYGLDKGYRIAHHGEATMPPSGNGGIAHPFTLTDGSEVSQVILQQDGLTVTAFAVNHAPVFPAAGL